MRKYSINEIQETNYLVVKSLSTMFESIFGPLGRYKLLKGEDLSEFPTTSGYNILKEIQYDHPTAKLFAEAAMKHGDIYRDGISQLILYLGELLSEAFSLFDLGIHPLTIVSGYVNAMSMVERYLSEISIDGSRYLRETAKTALKYGVYDIERLSEIVTDCIRKVSSNGQSDPEDILIVPETGDSAMDITSFNGLIIDREPVREDMPTHIANGKLALLNYPLENKKLRTENSKILISDSNKFRDLLYSEEELLLNEIDMIRNSGADIICCQKGICELAGELLSNYGILALKRVSNRDMKRLAKASGGKIVNSVDELDPSMLGNVGDVEVKKIGNGKYTFFREFPEHNVATLVIRGGSIHVIESVVGEIKSALYSVSSLIKTPKALPGGGATEIELAMRLRRYAKTIPGKEQLAIEKFANALEIIPKTLAKNSGLNPVDVLLELRAEHAKGNMYHGLEAVKGKVEDMLKAGVVDAYEVKRNILLGATEITCMLVRVDDAIPRKVEYGLIDEMHSRKETAEEVYKVIEQKSDKEDFY